jgi:zinc transport system substrate-binding protein
MYPGSMSRKASDGVSTEKSFFSLVMKKCLPLLVLLGFCLGVSEARGSDNPARLKIVTSVFPLREFAREIAGDRGEVSLLLPPGAGVHTWQPRASDVLRLSSADLFIYIGAGLEPWIPDLLKSLSAPKLRVLVLAESLPLQEHREGLGGEERDPHVWLDFGLDLIIADHLAALLSEIDPACASEYQERAGVLKARIRTLDAAYARALESCRIRSLFIGGHAAFGYLANRYGLEQISITGLSPDAEATPSRLIAAIERGKKNHIRAIYAEANTNSRIAEVVAKELHIEVLPLHPGANLSRKEWDSGRTFFDIMEVNLVNLKKGLACD